MNTMNMPGFTAEASLYNTRRQYQTDGPAINSSTQMISGSAICPAAKGREFPDHTCTCKGCGAKGGDVTGQCANVCTDKEVYAKGSEPHDYCNAARIRTLRDFFWSFPGGAVSSRG